MFCYWLCLAFSEGKGGRKKERRNEGGRERERKKPGF